MMEPEGRAVNEMACPYRSDGSMDAILFPQGVQALARLDLGAKQPLTARKQVREHSMI